MKNSIKKLSDSKIEILFEISWQEFQPFLDKAVLKLGENLKLNGFRLGKVPKEIVEKEVGEGKLLATAAEIALKQEYPKVMMEEKIEAIGSPQVEIMKLARGNPISFLVKVDILPGIQLPDCKKIASQVEKREVSIKDEEAKSALTWLQKSRASFEERGGEAKKGDFLEIEYKSPQIENNKLFQDRFLLGEGHFVPGFEQHLEGMKKGEEKKFSLTFPEDYTKKELAGKEIAFEVKLKKVQLVKLPKINDEFAKSLGKFNNLEELRKSVKEGITREKEIAERDRRRNEILEKIASSSDFEVPETLISLEKKRALSELRQRAEKGLKISFREYLEKIKKTEKELEDSFSKEAEKKVKNSLILRELGKREKIQVKEEEVEKAVQEFLKNYPDTEKIKKEEIDRDRLKEYYEGAIYNEKVFQVLENL